MAEAESSAGTTSGKGEGGGGGGRANFYLRLGTQAMTGGNVHAAYDRCEERRGGHI